MANLPMSSYTFVLLFRSFSVNFLFGGKQPSSAAGHPSHPHIFCSNVLFLTLSAWRWGLALGFSWRGDTTCYKGGES
ncbi:hypothetical protein SODALDRAFT_186515 [Sodiomyces alkalinus F11]|uniref:Uncharacterized protein n=1 Tax=Sodiomyces alkalinus (strain CBS 110278 / VKM F-3762 / F11) TaxID=1314773 RepID=A0A3N2PV07_SODAK|nr:hypothetical protein SODALDRAFT_186515 [Sodiomyces alkalinus F11]ROT38325.1 hypothetical protein SODALDRAFT_186515 [Sodiomyces alkalinus F11]